MDGPCYDVPRTVAFYLPGPIEKIKMKRANVPFGFRRQVGVRPSLAFVFLFISRFVSLRLGIRINWFRVERQATIIFTKRRTRPLWRACCYPGNIANLESSRFLMFNTRYRKKDLAPASGSKSCITPPPEDGTFSLLFLLLKGIFACGSWCGFRVAFYFCFLYVRTVESSRRNPFDASMSRRVALKMERTL